MNNEEKQQELKENGTQNESVRVLTEEEVRQIRGRPPTAIAAQVREINKQRKLRIKRNGKPALVPMVDIFMQEFLKNGGNATEAAMKIGKYKSRALAASAGSKYLRQARDLGRIIAEQKGYTITRLLESLFSKAVDSQMKDPAWMDRALKITGFSNFLLKEQGTHQTVNVMNVHKGLLNEYVDGSFEPELPEEEIGADGQD